MLNDDHASPTSAMAVEEAERFMMRHRRLLKHWTLTAVGFRDGDGPRMRAELEDNLPILASIADQFPQHAAAIGLLTEALSQGDKSGNTSRPH